MSVVRSAILAASKSSWMRDRAPHYAFVRRSVSRFMPGEHLEDALQAATQLQANGIAALLTRLGENITQRAEAEQVTNHYINVLSKLKSTALPAEISVKLTQLGLDLNREFCFDNICHLLENCPPERMLWIDMEQSPYVDITIELYQRARKQYKNVGVCLQAYLYRTNQDVAELIAKGGSVRLVKGAYAEPAEIAFPNKTDVDQNYFALAQQLLSPTARAAGVRTVIATHDRLLIGRITSWADTQAIPKQKVEFAMLYGIQREEIRRLASRGYPCEVLISYGSFWFPWFIRRLAERPANALFLARNLFSR